MPATKRSRKQNPVPFVRDDEEGTNRKSRSKTAKIHQKEEKLISSNISSKILKEALEQQKEIEEEEEQERNPNFKSIEEEQVQVETEEDIDDFAGFEDNKSFYDCGEEVDEDDEKLLDAFLSKDSGRQQTLADIIAQKIKDKDAVVSTGAPLVPKMDSKCIDVYKGVGEFLKKYTSGKLPKAVKYIPKTLEWENILYLTEPEKWSPNALYQVTRIFASNMGVKKAERFYKLVLLPRVRDDIRKNKRLHFALYQCLKKCLYKPAAFNKGILFPLCESRTCNLREAVIIGSIIQKVSIPPLHSSVAIMKLAEMEYCGTTSYFIKLLFEKKYALPYRVLDASVAHFVRFIDEERVMPVIWHQSLLAFVQRYKNELTKEDKKNLNLLIQVQKHRLVTPEIAHELNNSRSRGEKEVDSMSTDGTVTIICKPIEEDRFDIPPISMEED
uniref:Bystin n=1 Tax=Kalanchoe fedtschenkoi TaxID=63787 RepID=A0A7N0RCA8_KALFE